MDIEERNLRQIEQLNQRGGRTLSIVDLIEAGTITAEMAALCWMRMAAGASLLTGAVPGGAGKTTLMAAIMGFLPEGETIVTVADRAALEAAGAGRLPAPATALVHEIGPGHWYGYLWGRDAADFFALGSRARRASCLHADDPDQAADLLRPLGVSRDDLEGVGLQLYMCADMHHGRVRRRVSSLYCRADGRFGALYRLDGIRGRFESLVGREEVCRTFDAQSNGPASSDEDWRAREQFLDQLLRDGVRAYADVRRAVVARDRG